MSGMELLSLAAAGRSDGTSSSSTNSASSTVDQNKHILLSHSNSVTVTTTANKSLRSNKIISRSNNDSNKISLPPKKRMKLNFYNASCGSSSMNDESSFQLRSSDTSLSSSWMSVVSSSSTTSSHGTLNSEWTETMTTEIMMRPRKEVSSLLQQLCNSSVIVPKDKNKGGRISSKKEKSNSNGLKRQLYSDSSVNNDKAANKKKTSSLLKDVNGNDMCMGYFSMPSRKSPAEEQTILPLPTTTVNPQDENQGEPNYKRLFPRMNQIIVHHSSTNTTANGTPIPDNSPENQFVSIAAKSLLYQTYLQALNQPSFHQ